MIDFRDSAIPTLYRFHRSKLFLIIFPLLHLSANTTMNDISSLSHSFSALSAFSSSTCQTCHSTTTLTTCQLKGNTQGIHNRRLKLKTLNLSSLSLGKKRSATGLAGNSLGKKVSPVSPLKLATNFNLLASKSLISLAGVTGDSPTAPVTSTASHPVLKLIPVAPL